MNRARWAAALAFLGFLGCAGGESTPPATTATAPKPPVVPLKLADIKLTDKEIAEIKTLPDAADQTAALEQKVCAVGEDEKGIPNHLGAMGAPLKKVVKGKTVFLCCGGCVEDLEKDPDKALARIGK